MRTFIAIELPQHITAALGNVQETLKSAKLNIRWVRPENIHLTLKFLGDTPPEAVGPISRSATTSSTLPCSVASSVTGTT